jgi:hypothetical protein
MKNLSPSMETMVRFGPSIGPVLEKPPTQRARANAATTGLVIGWTFPLF